MTPEMERKLYLLFEQKLEKIYEEKREDQRLSHEKAESSEHFQELLRKEWYAYLRGFSKDMKVLHLEVSGWYRRTNFDGSNQPIKFDEVKGVVVADPLYTTSNSFEMSEEFALKVLSLGLP